MVDQLKGVWQQDDRLGEAKTGGGRIGSVGEDGGGRRGDARPSSYSFGEKQPSEMSMASPFIVLPSAEDLEGLLGGRLHSKRMGYDEARRPVLHISEVT